MNPTELFHADGKSAGIFYCGTCRHVATSKAVAEACCADRKCEDCGGELTRFWTVCESCRDAREKKREAERFEKAEKVDPLSGELIYCEGFGDDGYCDSLGELLDELDDQEEGDARPAYAWCCKPKSFVCATFERATGDFDDAYESWDDGQLCGVKELKAAIESFNEANRHHISWHPDYSRAVLVPAKEAQPVE